jgi:elongation factor G
MQLNIILKTLREKYKLELVTDVRGGVPRNRHQKAEAQYKHKKQSGGHGSTAKCTSASGLSTGRRIRVQGQHRRRVVPGSTFPRGKGVKEGLDEGVLARFPIVDIAVELFFGSYHDVDSSEMSFKIAARNCLKKAMEAAGRSSSSRSWKSTSTSTRTSRAISERHHQPPRPRARMGTPTSRAPAVFLW